MYPIILAIILCERFHRRWYALRIRLAACEHVYLYDAMEMGYTIIIIIIGYLLIERVLALYTT